MVLLILSIMLPISTVYADKPGGGLIEPPLGPICRNTPYYDIWIDIGSATGAIEGTVDEEDASVFVPVKMYAMDMGATPDTSLNLEEFGNYITYDPDELRLVGVIPDNWPELSFDVDSSTLGIVEVNGVQGNLDMPNGLYLTIYTLEFRIKCNTEDDINLDLSIDWGVCPDNFVQVADGSFFERYDDWGSSEGFVHIQQYIAETHFDDVETLLGDASVDVTAYGTVTNFHFDSIAHYIRFDDDNYEFDDVIPYGVSESMSNRQATVDGDSICVMIWTDGIEDPIGEIGSATVLYKLRFTPINTDTDSLESPVGLITDANNTFAPAECHSVANSISVYSAPGSISVPDYKVWVYFDWDEDNRDLDGYTYLDVWLKNNFAAGLMQTGGGNIQLLIEHDSRLIFEEDVTYTHPDVTIDANGLDPYDLVSVTLLPPNPPTVKGFIDPSPDDSVLYCTLKFSFDQQATYDCPDELWADLEAYLSPQYLTVFGDTTGAIECTIDAANPKVFGYGDFTWPACTKYYADDVSGGTDIPQAIRLWHGMDVDSVLFHLQWEPAKFCILDIDLTPGVEVCDITSSLMKFHGDNLGLQASQSTILATIHFGPKNSGTTEGISQFVSLFGLVPHVVDTYSSTLYPVLVSGDIDGYLGAGQGSICPSNPITKQGGEIIPKQYALHQNYPNPFNPTTTISFDVGELSWVRLEVFNLLGQKVETLIDCAMDPGSYEVDWTPGAEVPSGVYFYVIQSGDFNQTKKMMLLK